MSTPSTAAVPMPPKRRAFFCTKCHHHTCVPGQEHETHPLCDHCGYLGFASDCDYNDEEMRTYADACAQQARRETLTDEQIDAVTDAQWGKGCAPNQYQAHRAYARAIIRALGGAEK